jgi:MFS family permease
MTDKQAARYALGVLFLINAMNFFDRMILGAVTEPLRKEWQLSDVAVGWLGTAFTLIYAVVGLPVGSLADRASRRGILAAGVFVWSLLTATSGLTRSFWQLFAVRLGVGVGEATCAPAATSLIGDLFPAAKRARALSIFMMGLPIGIALSYLVSTQIAHAYGWRAAFYVAGVPGLFCTLAVFFIREPRRGAAEAHRVGSQRRTGSPFRLVLSIPTMWWIIASGALFNFIMYAIGSFLAPYLMRFHGMDIRQTGFVAMVVYGLSGLPALVLGGILGDRVARARPNGRMLFAAWALLASVPLMYCALSVPRGQGLVFTLLMGLGCAVLYAYYSMVYPAIQDVIEPSLRGTAMAIYFFAMYVLGASLGPVGTGFASDYFTRQAAAAAGVDLLTQQALEPFRAEGLRSAMYLIPVLGSALAIVLFAGAATIARDMERLQTWMRGCVASEPLTEGAEA